MFNMGMTELIVIFVIALLVFGPKKLPELGKSLGKAMSEFKRSTQEVKDNLEREVGTEKIKQELLKEQREIKEALTMPDKPAGDDRKPEAEGGADDKPSPYPDDKPKSHAG